MTETPGKWQEEPMEEGKYVLEGSGGQWADLDKKGQWRLKTSKAQDGVREDAVEKTIIL